MATNAPLSPELNAEECWARDFIESIPPKERPDRKRRAIAARGFEKEFIARRWDFRNVDIVGWFREHDHYIGEHDSKPGRHYTGCPFEHEHSEKRERVTDSIISDGTDLPPFFFCSHGHSHCEDPEAHGRHDLEAIADLWGDAGEFGARRLDELLQRNDDGNAIRLYTQFGDHLRYCPPFKQWYVWDKTHWRLDQAGTVTNYMRAILAALKAEAETMEPKEKREFQRFYNYASSDRGVRGALHLAQSLMPVMPEQLDQDPMLLNFQNGVLNLWTGGFTEAHNPEDYITRVLPFNYDPAADCPRWGEFLYSVTGGDPLSMRYLQRAVGYSLTGMVSEKCFFMLCGPGNTGKSTFLEAIGGMLGDYAKATQPALLLTKKGEGVPSDLAALKGARFAWTSEVEEGKRVSTAAVKAMTGNDTLQARFLYKEWFSFTPQFKLWLAVNHKPVIRESGRAIWERVRIIPFVVQTQGAQQNKRMLEDLKAERAGMLQWALEGFRQWRASGLGSCPEVDHASRSYEKEMDLLTQFLDEECVRGPDCQSTTKAMHEYYVEWCRRANEFTVSLRRFGGMLEERGIERRDVHRVMICFGIRPMNSLERTGIGG